MSNTKIPESIKREIEKRHKDLFDEIERLYGEASNKKYRRLVSVLKKCLPIKKDIRRYSVQNLEEISSKNANISQLVNVVTLSKVKKMLDNHLKKVIGIENYYNFESVDQIVKNEKKAGREYDVQMLRMVTHILYEYGQPNNKKKRLKEANLSFIHSINKILKSKLSMSKIDRAKLISEVLRMYECVEVYCQKRDGVAYVPGLKKFPECRKKIIPAFKNRADCDHLDTDDYCCLSADHCAKITNQVKRVL